MHAVEDEQHFLIDCPLHTFIGEQDGFLFEHDQGGIRHFFSAMLTKCLVLLATSTCAFMPGCPMSHIRLSTPDRKLY